MNKKIALLIIALLLIAVVGGAIFLKGRTEKDGLSVPGKEISNETVVEPKEQKESFSDNRTREGYAKAREAAEEGNNPRLGSIYLANNQYSKDKLSYVFVTEKEIITVNYDSDSKTAELVDKREKRTDNTEGENAPSLPFFAGADYPAVPEEVMNMGPEDMVDILSGNEEYKNYKQKFPNMFNYYNASLIYSEEYKWEWNFSFYELDAQEQNKVVRSLNMAVNVADKKAVMMGTDNVD